MSSWSEPADTTIDVDGVSVPTEWQQRLQRRIDYCSGDDRIFAGRAPPNPRQICADSECAELAAISLSSIGDHQTYMYDDDGEIHDDPRAHSWKLTLIDAAATAALRAGRLGNIKRLLRRGVVHPMEALVSQLMSFRSDESASFAPDWFHYVLRLRTTGEESLRASHEKESPQSFDAATRWIDVKKYGTASALLSQSVRLSCGIMGC